MDFTILQDEDHMLVLALNILFSLNKDVMIITIAIIISVLFSSIYIVISICIL